MIEENNKGRDETIRQLIERAIRYGRSRQSRQTGYIHLCYHPEEGEGHDSIPIVENILFALALFHSRTTEQVIEAKGMLDRILYFQSQSGEFSCGNFPIYLHEYPQCKDRLLGVSLLAPFHWILKLFSQVLGSELKQRLETAARALLLYCLKTNREKAAPYQIALKIAAAAVATGTLLHEEAIEQEGNALLASLHASPDANAWHSPAYLADLLIALQMVYPSIANSQWSNLWDHLGHTWHRPTCSYVGLPLKEYQKGCEPQPTLYDLFLGYFSGAFSKRSLQDNLFQLQAVLIRHTEDRLPQLEYPFALSGNSMQCNWHLEQLPGYAYSVIEKKVNHPISTDKGMHAFRFVWGNQERAHTFVGQGGNIAAATFKAQPNGVDLFFSLAELMPQEDREKSREVILYFDIEGIKKIKFNGERATIFQLGEEIAIETDSLLFSARFILESGEGQFMGHIMRGNRPSQISIKGSERFKAYDWQLFLRTLQRSADCCVKVEIRVAEVE